MRSNPNPMLLHSLHAYYASVCVCVLQLQLQLVFVHYFYISEYNIKRLCIRRFLLLFLFIFF